MSIPTVAMHDPFCCFIPGDQQGLADQGLEVKGCTASAVWDLWTSSDPYGNTQACEMHVGALIGDQPLWYIERIAEPQHDSDCSLHNAPAMRPEPCDCSQNRARRLAARTVG